MGRVMAVQSDLPSVINNSSFLLDNEQRGAENRYRVINNLSDKCLDTYFGEVDNTTGVIQMNCSQGFSIIWELRYMNNGHYQFINVDSGKCMDTPWGSTEDWAHMFIYTCSDAADSMDWRLSDLGNDSYNIINRKSGKCLDIELGVTDNWTKIIQFPCHSGESMKWRLESLTPAPTEDSLEPNNSASQATLYEHGDIQLPSIVPADDVDWGKFVLIAESAILIETASSNPNDDTRLWLYDVNLVELEFNDDNGDSRGSKIDRTCGTDALPAGTYYFKVDEYDNNDVIERYGIEFRVTEACPQTGGIVGYVGSTTIDSVTVVASDSGRTFTTQADGEGIFSFDNVPYGRYTITPSKAGYTFSPTTRSVVVPSFEALNVAFSVSQVANGGLAGHVADTNNSSLEEVRVILSGNGESDSDMTNFEGIFTFGGLPDGTYTIVPRKSGYTFNPTSQEATVPTFEGFFVEFTAIPNADELQLSQQLFLPLIQE